MPMHIGTTGGLVLGGIYCVLRGLHARKEGWPVGDTMQGCYTGYSFQKEEFDYKRPLSTYMTVGGAAVTFVAKKTGYNQDTPNGWNL